MVSVTGPICDYAVWQEKLLGGKGDKGSLIARQLDYWTEHFAIYRSNWSCPPIIRGRLLPAIRAEACRFRFRVNCIGG